MRISLEMSGGQAIVRGLESARSRIRDFSEPLAMAGSYLLGSIWERITRKPLAYSERYTAWLVANGEFSGKLVGILSGALIGAIAPGGAGGGDLAAEADDRQALIGFLQPREAAKAAGFCRWFARKYGEPAITMTERDAQVISGIFDQWLAGAVAGGG